MPHKITLMGKRGRYSLVRNYAVIATGTNRERLRGIQFFLEAKPEYAAAPELLEALEEMEPAFNNLIDNMAQQDKATDDTIALMTVYIKASQKARAAIAKAKGE